MEVDKNLVKKYLNFKGIDNAFDDFIDEVFLEVKSISNPKKLCVLSDVSKENGFYKLNKLGLLLKSEDINSLFTDCESIATMVVTLGLAVDKKIALYAKTDMTRSLVMDAVASVYVESLLDKLEEEVCTQTNLNKTMRFSPGYGDLDIAIQKDLIKAVGADKYLGIMVNSNNLMVPLKSITAFIGFSTVKQVFSSICLTCPQKGNCKTKCSKANI